MSPIQVGSLSVNNSVTNLSRLGTFNGVAAVVGLPACCCWLLLFQASLLLLALLLCGGPFVPFIPAVAGGHAIAVIIVVA